MRNLIFSNTLKIRGGVVALGAVFWTKPTTEPQAAVPAKQKPKPTSKFLNRSMRFSQHLGRFQFGAGFYRD